jgi:hypothetical protein
MLKRDMNELSRHDVFEIYLRPRDPDPNEIAPDSPQTWTFRERAFHNLQAGGLTWLESEHEWQRHTDK